MLAIARSKADTKFGPVLMLQEHWFSVVKKVQPIGATRANSMKVWEVLPEKWSAKYKRAINCARPRGFSQRAHCAGRKKK